MKHLLFPAILLLFGCGKVDDIATIKVINESSVGIVVKASTSHPDTIARAGALYPVTGWVDPGEYSETDIKEDWKQRFSVNSGQRLIFFIMSVDSFNKNSSAYTEAHLNDFVLKRIDLSLSQMEDNNWVIRYK